MSFKHWDKSISFGLFWHVILACWLLVVVGVNQNGPCLIYPPLPCPWGSIIELFGRVIFCDSFIWCCFLIFQLCIQSFVPYHFLTWILPEGIPSAALLKLPSLWLGMFCSNETCFWQGVQSSFIMPMTGVLWSQWCGLAYYTALESILYFDDS